MQFTQPILAIDTETGGFRPSQHALLSIGMACSWSTQTFEAYITPESQAGKTVDPEAAAVNGYTPEAWQFLKAMPITHAMTLFFDWLACRLFEQPQAVLVCHNISHDKSFLLEAALHHCARDLPHRNHWRCSQSKFGELMDLGAIERGSSSLNRLLEVSGWPGVREKQHNARQDAEATVYAYAWLLNKGKQAEQTLRHLHARADLERSNLEALMLRLREALRSEHLATGADERALVFNEFETLCQTLEGRAAQ